MKQMSAADAIKNGMKDSQTPPTDKEGRVLLKMRSGFGYSTPSEVHFTKQHPFQLVTEAEAQSLLAQERFDVATREEVLAYYNKS